MHDADPAHQPGISCEVREDVRLIRPHERILNNAAYLAFINTTNSIYMENYQCNEHAAAMIGRGFSTIASQIVVSRGGIET